MSTTPLAPLYARWMEECLGGEIPSEERATCLDCAMCGERAERDGTTEDLRYNPDTKCCTFFPDLPNYLVGALLADETAGLTARPLVAAAIRERRGATPLGLSATPAFWDRFQAQQGQGSDVAGWGRDLRLRCPYYNAEGGGLCGLWLHRNAECSTWFCKHRDGALGKRFWVAMTALLNAVEVVLPRWCLEQLGLDAAALGELYDGAGRPRLLKLRQLRGAVDDEGRLEPDLDRRVWGSWSGREEDLYRACADLVARLSWPEVLALGGEGVAALEARVKEARPELHASAELLYRGQFAVMPLVNGKRLRLRAPEASNEPLELPAGLVRALGAFNGRRTTEVLADLAAHRIALDEATMQALRRRGILVPPDGNDLPPIARGAGPLAPGDWLRFFRGYRGAAVTLTESAGPTGAPRLTLSSGGAGISFDDPLAAPFVRQLHRHQQGFRAGDAAGWIGGGPGAWEAVSGVLGALLNAEILQRDPAARP